jgi:hypothetical protein
MPSRFSRVSGSWRRSTAGDPEAVMDTTRRREHDGKNANTLESSAENVVDTGDSGFWNGPNFIHVCMSGP